MSPRIVKALAIAFIVSINLTASAQLCSDLFSAPPAGLSAGTTLNSASVRGLHLTGVVHRGTEVIGLRQKGFGDNFSSDSFIDFKNNPSPFNFLYFSPEYASGLSRVHSAYGDRLSQTEKTIVNSEDWGLFFRDLQKLNISFATVAADGTQKNINSTHVGGFLRVVQTDETEKSPAENILADKRIASDYFDNFRRSGYLIFEVGKFFVSKDLSPMQRKATKRELLTWFYDYFLAPGKLGTDKVIFVFDTSHPVQANLYKADYGAEVIPSENFSPPLSKTDQILIVSLATLRERVAGFLLK